jgi:Uncharacterized ACR, COG1430
MRPADGPQAALMATAWVLRDGLVLVAARVEGDYRTPARRMARWDAADEAVLLDRARGLRLGATCPAVDVAFLDRELFVLDTTRLVRRWRLARPRRRGRSVLVARAGSFERWRLQVGDQLEIRETE